MQSFIRFLQTSGGGEIKMVFDHKERHKILHKELDELSADFIKHTGKVPSKSTIMELMSWSYEQTINPVGK